MAKDESRRDRWVKASQRLRDAFQMAAVSCYMMVLFAQPAAAADTMWTRFSTIIADVYGELVGISTIVAVTAAAVALLVRMISRNERAVAEATQLAEENRRDLDRAQYPGLCGRLPAAADPGRTVHAVDHSLIPERAKSNLRRICQ